MTRRIPFIFATAIVAALFARTSNGQPTVINDLIEVKATVESVDQRARMVLLRDDRGALETVYVSPAVRNLAQVHPGDFVLVSMHRSVALDMSMPGTAPRTSVEGTAWTAMPGSRPSAFRTQIVHARVQIQTVDLGNRTVSFVGPAGILRVMQVDDPRLLDVMRRLHPGDEVDVTYSVGVAASVVAARG